jgi:hypothetical protein
VFFGASSLERVAEACEVAVGDVLDGGHRAHPRLGPPWRE